MVVFHVVYESLYVVEFVLRERIEHRSRVRIIKIWVIEPHNLWSAHAYSIVSNVRLAGFLDSAI